MQARLWIHPAHPSAVLDGIEVGVERPSATSLRFRYLVSGDIEGLVLPSPAPPLRADKLWRTTCFEAFLAPVRRPGYRELNFSPSSQWAAYDFSAYRSGLVQAPVAAPPEIHVTSQAARLEQTVTLSLDLGAEPYRLGLAAIIEERGGAISYWALAHPPGEPDFHHPDCFALHIPAPDAA